MSITHRLRRTRRIVAAALTVGTGVAAAGVVTAGAAAAAVPPGCTQTGRTVTCEFGYTGAEQTFAVPDGVTSLTAALAGAAGGDADGGGGIDTGGPGAVVTGRLDVVGGSTLYLEVGQDPGVTAFGRTPPGGWNGGGPGGYGQVTGSGGGATDVRTASGGSDPAAAGLDSRLVVAGGGGGGGEDRSPSAQSPGGAAGADGVPETPTEVSGQGGRAGTQTSGGAGGLSSTGTGAGTGLRGGAGSVGRGGSGAGGFRSAGGGGGGFYGGGGGGNSASPVGAVRGGGSGGGGSSLVPAGFTLEGATNDGNGRITLSYTLAPVAGAISATSGGGQSAQAGAAFAQPLEARVTDPTDGSPIPGAPVTFEVTEGSATFPNGTRTTTVTTGSDGGASTPLTAGEAAGPVTVTATTPGVATPATFTGTVTAPPPAADRADLTAALTVPASLRAGGTGQVVLTVRNTGPGAANRVASGIALPNGLTATNGGGGAVSKDKRAVGFAAPTIAVNGTVTYTITVTADRNASGSKSIGGGVLSTATRDPNLGNNYQVKQVPITR